MTYSHTVLHVAALAALSSFTCPAQADLRITEFMASNTRTVLDDDGKDSDFIEIANTSGAAVNIGGWHLTDDAARLDKWTFPSLVLPPYGRILVWASNEDRRDPAQALHTNFSLKGSGEYLALVRPDETVEQDFGASYPPQFPDVSYGLGEATPPPVILLAAGSNAFPGPACRVRVPVANPAPPTPDNADEASWMLPGFDDSGAEWTPAHTGLGFTLVTPSVNPQPPNSGNLFPPLLAPDGNLLSLWQGKNRGIYIRIPFTVAEASRIKKLTLKMHHDDGFVAYINGTLKAHANAATAPALPDTPVSWNVPTSGPGAVPSIANADANAATLVEIPILGANDGGVLSNGSNLLAIHGFNESESGDDALINPQLSAELLPALNGTTVYFSVPTPNATNNAGAQILGPAVGETSKDLPPIVLQAPWGGIESLPLVTSAATGFSGTQGQSGWQWGYFAGNGAYSAAAFVAAPGGAGQGAWNGTTQWWSGTGWDHNTAGAQPWTYLSGTLMHPNDSNPGPREAPIARWTSTVAGNYTINGSFTRANGADDGTTGRVFLNGVQIFSALTLANTQPFQLPVTLAAGDQVDFLVDVGPGDSDSFDSTTYVAEIREGHPPPLLNTPIKITARVARTIHPIASVSLKWRRMYYAEQTASMVDNGTGGDDLANDGIYTASLASSGLLPGEMIRWRVEAVDSFSYLTKDPPYLLPAEDQQYYGTIVENPATATSLLPVIHWFMPTGVDPGGSTKTRIELYFKGELYDNCRSTGHGQSTASFPKRSYDIDSPSDHRMKVFDDPMARRAKDINLLSNYADKSKMRTTLAYETYQAAGALGHYAFPVRMQFNGQFQALMDFVEDADDRFIDRLGLDPNGALYKVYNTLNSANITTTNSGGVEKKTRRDDPTGTADFAAMITSLAETNSLAQRRQYAYDNVNIPQLVNMMAVSGVILHNDWGHKNYFMYRDSDGTKEWYLLPWDVDLSFGHTWVGGQGYFDDDIDSSKGLFLGASNRLKSLLEGSGSGSGATAAPELVQMFLRRIRTLLDRFVGTSPTPAAEFETRMNYWADQIDPLSLPAGTSDAALEWKKWGYWVDGSGTQLPYTNAAAADHTLRNHLRRMINYNPNPPYPSSNPNAHLGRTTIPAFLAGRRTTLYSIVHQGQAMPAAQAAAPAITISSVDYNPGTGNQEYVKLTNTGPVAVDVSGWTLSGAIDFRIPDGTIIPTGNGTTENIGALFVVKDKNGFRARTTGPRAGQYCFCVGGYKGQLSARGETLVLSNAEGTQIDTNTWAPSPTAAQQALRITQILFKPNNPTGAELTAIPELIASDFEWLEITNIGSTLLDLSGAQFTEGIAYTFPANVTLAAGAKLILAAHPAAFALRYPAVSPVLGPWVGQLSNSGEQLHLLDAAGESVLEFSYNDSWYPPADSAGHSLVMVDPASTPYNEWGGRPRWGVSLAPNGTPGAAVSPLGMVYNFWANTPFTREERDDPLTSGPGVDGDSDGLANLTEYALGGNPKSAVSAPLPVGGRTTVDGLDYLTLSFRRQKNALDLQYVVETCTDLETDWQLLQELPVSVIDNNDGTETVTVREQLPLDAARRFIRLKIHLLQ
ncbi:MAG: lamin tail domain-containing protein [Verrucomicrobiales bacterium]|nr:lamin tail domain-containing protein [Verrucomicrobiales bacterium]